MWITWCRFDFQNFYVVSLMSFRYWIHGTSKLIGYCYTHCCFYFFLSGFSFTDTEGQKDSRGREGPPFIPIHHFHQITTIQIFIFSFACEMTIIYFQSHRLYLPDCYSIRFSTFSNYHLIDWWRDVSFCLLTWWFDFSFWLQYLTKLCLDNIVCSTNLF